MQLSLKLSNPRYTALSYNLCFRWFAAFLNHLTKSGSPIMTAMKSDLLRDLTERTDGEKLKVLEVGVGTGELI